MIYFDITRSTVVLQMRQEEWSEVHNQVLWCSLFNGGLGMHYCFILYRGEGLSSSSSNTQPSAERRWFDAVREELDSQPRQR